jgi:hypothetical protein
MRPRFQIILSNRQVPGTPVQPAGFWGPYQELWCWRRSRDSGHRGFNCRAHPRFRDCRCVGHIVNDRNSHRDCQGSLCPLKTNKRLSRIGASTIPCELEPWCHFDSNWGSISRPTVVKTTLNVAPPSGAILGLKPVTMCFNRETDEWQPRIQSLLRSGFGAKISQQIISVTRSLAGKFRRQAPSSQTNSFLGSNFRDNKPFRRTQRDIPIDQFFLTV